MTPRAVFVTGALGFIGRAVADRYRAAGAEVRSVDVRADPAGGVVAGDIAEPGLWQEHAAGCDLVVHTAWVVSNVAGASHAWDVNVRGTRHVLDAAAAGGATRFVHFSSAAVYGHVRPDPVDERHPVRPTGATYGDTKIAAEQVVLQAHAAREVMATILRPGDVYGPGSRSWTVLPVEMLRRHQVLLPARGRGTFNPVFVDDLVDAVLLAATAEDGAGQVFNVTAGTAVDTREFFVHYTRMLGIAPAPVAPTSVAMVVAELLGRVSRALGRPSEASAATVRMLAGQGAVSIEKARRVLGYEPRVGLAEGMHRTEAWLRAEGMLDRAAGAVSRSLP
jgi:nucleoside-diphosphate-sugar epimerase